MKKRLCNFNLAFLLIWIANPTFAGTIDGDITKEKTVSKTYLVNPDAGVDISNKYGNIYVTTWNEDKISIDVLIKVSGKNEEAVNKRLNGINIELNPLTSLVSAKTVFGDSSGKNMSIQVNYTIKIPKKGSVALDNRYGNIVIDRISGKSDITCKYGTVNIAELNNDKNSLKIEYCDNSSIGTAKNAVVYARYSGLAINKVDALSVDGNYTNLTVKTAENIKYNANYGDITVNSLENLQGSGNYLVLKFGTVSGNFDLKTAYSSLNVGHLSESANNVSIASSYTNIDLQYDSGYAFDFEFNLKYAGLNAAGLSYQTKKESGSTAYYKGFYKSEGRHKMTVNSSYGNLKLTKE